MYVFVRREAPTRARIEAPHPPGRQVHDQHVVGNFRGRVVSEDRRIVPPRGQLRDRDRTGRQHRAQQSLHITGRVGMGCGPESEVGSEPARGVCCQQRDLELRRKSQLVRPCFEVGDKGAYALAIGRPGAQVPRALAPRLRRATRRGRLHRRRPAAPAIAARAASRRWSGYPPSWRRRARWQTRDLRRTRCRRSSRQAARPSAPVKSPRSTGFHRGPRDHNASCFRLPSCRCPPLTMRGV
jgi:hypothetical protein